MQDMIFKNVPQHSFVGLLMIILSKCSKRVSKLSTKLRLYFCKQKRAHLKNILFDTIDKIRLLLSKFKFEYLSLLDKF